ncbi:DUF4850 domain-containing protein [Dyella sp. 20L07]|uniref:DUF4850 domain-containing protein n=1 Tax=Dyella sp. 20L07 TaxID=3384240 RepID=UPI003D2E24EA
MRARHRRLFFLAIFSLLVCWLPALHAETAVRELPATPELQSAVGTDYVLHSSTFGGVPITLIDVNSGEGDWIRPDGSALPAFPRDPPVAMKEQLQWFYGGVVGWMPVPLGWRVQRAVIGADGSTVYTFVAADGAASGWVTYTVIPACVGCLLQEAEGLLPGVMERLTTLNDAPAASLGQTNPVMDQQTHSDDCTALFRYRRGALSVHAAVLSSEPIAVLDSQKGDVSVADIYVALPASKSSLAEFLTSSLRAAFPACHAPNGWPG